MKPFDSYLSVEEFKTDLFKEFGVENNPKRERLFKFALNCANSSGYCNVYFYFELFVNQIKTNYMFFCTIADSCVPEGKVTDFEFTYEPKEVLSLKSTHILDHVRPDNEWNLHEFMFEIYKKKGGEKEYNEFNEINVILTIKDIDLIESKIQSKEIHILNPQNILPIQMGFSHIKERIKNENIVAFYNSWW